MESLIQFDGKISLDAKEYNRVEKGESIDSLVLKKAREQYEGRCIHAGIILPRTLKVLARSSGNFEAGRFYGFPSYYVRMEAGVIYPTNGSKITGKVVRKNKMGLYVIHRDSIRIQVARDIHIDNEDFENVVIGDDVEMELKKSRFQINDPFILSCASFISNKSKQTSKLNAV